MEIMPSININPDKCIRDGLCTALCRKVFSRDGEDAVPVAARPEFCNSCGHCVLICPVGAITHENCPPERIHTVNPGLLPSYENMKEAIVSRRSIRTFQDKPVERTVMEAIIDGARHAPTAKNTQSTRYIVVRDKKLLGEIAAATALWLEGVSKKLRNPAWGLLYALKTREGRAETKRRVGQFMRIAEEMQAGRDAVLFDAPALVLFYTERGVTLAEANTNLAVQNATLIAASLGLGSFYTGYVVMACRHDKTIPRLLRLPAGCTIYGGLALGYPKITFSRWIERNKAEVDWL